MGHYINLELGYYEGDKIDYRDTEVPQRPDAYHKWDGKAWVEDVDAVKAKEVEDAKAKLVEIDLKSIRALREYITGDIKTKETAMILLVEREIEAQTERIKLAPDIPEITIVEEEAVK